MNLRINTKFEKTVVAFFVMFLWYLLMIKVDSLITSFLFAFDDVLLICRALWQSVSFFLYGATVANIVVKSNVSAFSFYFIITSLVLTTFFYILY